ncbi:MAG: hypothetical protein OXH97_08835 [Chloroflexota bacterium]|nr:hypothetical protein [Chloroflexota bacterium]MXW24132.1 hypothetical protein [Chloroflexota bacterium]
MGTKELEALIAVLERETKAGREGHALGTWTIRYDKERSAFSFDHCESEVYCNERPAVIATDGSVIDPGGPIEF